MIALAGCSTRHRIIVAGSKSMELMLELHRRGYLHAAATGNCGRPAGQYDVALVDWRRRTLGTLEATLDWLANFDRNGEAVFAVLKGIYGRDAKLWQRRWRLFFLATAGLFGHAGGEEWGVSHYRLTPAR